MRPQFEHFRQDALGGITAAVVALPLALAFGVSSGVGPVAGLYGAIMVGFFASLLGGTATQISGPTGPMTVVVAALVIEYGALYPESSLAVLFTIFMLAGLFQIGFGMLQLGQYMVMIPYPVISGFMSGIGVIILILELPPLLGVSGSGGVVDILGSVSQMMGQTDMLSVCLGGGTLALLFIWPQKFNRYLPSPLFALIAGTLLVFLLFSSSGLELIGPIPSALPSLHFPVIPLESVGRILGSAVLLAALGSIDSLLTSLVADSVTRTQHNSDKELIGQGVGNFAAGLIGGLPGAGATMRTLVNIRAGGKTPLAGMIHALVLLAIMMGLGGLVQYVPQVVLAGILFKVGIDIIDWRFILRIHKLPAPSSALMLLVLGMTVFIDLITAVIVGVFVANLITVKRLSNLQLDEVAMMTVGDGLDLLDSDERMLLEKSDGQIVVFHVHGPLCFGAITGLNRRLSDLGEHRVMVVDLKDATIVGLSTEMVIENVLNDADENGRFVLLAGLGPVLKHRLEKLGMFVNLPEKHIVDSRKRALEIATELI